MAIPISKLDRFKLETEFRDGYVVHTTYDWEYSTKGPQKLARWEEVKQIGSGAFGSVWLEKETGGGGLRAVKRLQRDSLAGFSQELLALVTLTNVSVSVRGLLVWNGFNADGQHKHLFVEFLGWYENRDNVFLAMEYITYGDLSGYMKDHTGNAVICEITRQILEGLKMLHGENICHRDLKPQVRCLQYPIVTLY